MGDSSGAAADPLPIVTFRTAQSVLTRPEALESVDQVARDDDTATPVQKAAAAAVMGRALDALRRAEAPSDVAVLSSPHDGPATRLQSLIASGARGRLTFEPLSTGGLEAKFDTDDWIGWATIAWAKLKHWRKHEMLRPRSAVPEPFPEQGRVAVIGDWGTGLYGAPEIGKSILRDPDGFAMLLHLGDTYYSGSETEMQRRFLDPWPFRTGARSRALNSNHDMYSGGDAYFGSVLPAFQQEGSYFAAQNKHWTLVGLDVAYKDHDIDDDQVAWLEQVLAQAGTRKVVLFSHHQLYSHLEAQGTKLWGHPGLGKVLRSKRIFAWYWGHEHRCALFETPDQTFGLWGRCIGHGGMPDARDRTRVLPRAGGPLYERAEWRLSQETTREGLPLPAMAVLDGPNAFIPGEEDRFAPHGYAVLTFDGPSLLEQVLDPRGQVIYERRLG